MTVKSGVALLVLLLVCVSCSREGMRCSHDVGGDVVPIQSPPDAARFLRQVELRYGQVSSYSDSGCVFITFGGRFGHTDRRPFATSFARPSTFRYEFTAFPGFLFKTRYVVWTEGGMARAWWTLRPKIENFRTIAMALPGGVSGGSSHTIPRLLLGPAAFGSWITRIRNPRLLGAQRLPTGTVCYVFTGEDGRGDPVRLWVEPATLAIHRIHVRSALRSGEQYDTTTTYDPHFDTKIDPAEIPFTPPRQVSIGKIRRDVQRKSDRKLVCHCN
jgi:hypothetical protein